MKVSKELIILHRNTPLLLQLTFGVLQKIRVLILFLYFFLPFLYTGCSLKE